MKSLVTCSSILVAVILAAGHSSGILNAAKNIDAADLQIMQKNGVRIGHRVGGKFSTICTGVLLSSSRVASADHCLNGREKELAEKKILAQVYDPATGGSKVIEVASRDDSLAFEGADVDALLLSKDAPVTDTVPIALSACDRSGTGKEDKVEFYIAGFGNDGEGPLKSTLKVARYTELNENEASKAYPESDLRHSPKTWLHLKSVEGIGCNGDSGSPIYCRTNGKLALAGILSGLDSDPSKPGALPEKSTDLDKCKFRPLAAATKLGAYMGKVNEWRGDSGSVSGSDSAPTRK